MGTPAGFAVFSDPDVNSYLKKILDAWGFFLKSPSSRYVLTACDKGWFGPKASKRLPNFAETFLCDPLSEYYGFTSWDDFFTRQFRPGVRPVAEPDNGSIIINACESTVYRIAHRVKDKDRFWFKGEPCSLKHMLRNDPFASIFARGTVYQATLGPTSYHRWHSPVNGTIIRTMSIPGTYFAEFPAIGSKDNPDMHNSQTFAASTATRAVIFIEADNRDIGLMCFMAVGLVEVSTCEVTVQEGARVKKGEQLGMFHFGGSTYCLLFRPETRLAFVADLSRDKDVHLNAALAIASST